MYLLAGIDTEGDNQWDAAARADWYALGQAAPLALTRALGRVPDHLTAVGAETSGADDVMPWLLRRA